MRYWVNTVSRSHVQNGVAGGFTQADHGKNSRLKRLSKGDRIVFYSPRTEFQAREPLQHFTAIGEIIDETPYQIEMSADFHPWRRRVKFLASAEAPISSPDRATRVHPQQEDLGLHLPAGLVRDWRI